LFRTNPHAAKIPAPHTSGLAWSFCSIPHAIPSVVYFCHTFCIAISPYCTLPLSLKTCSTIQNKGKEQFLPSNNKKPGIPNVPLQYPCARK